MTEIWVYENHDVSLQHATRVCVSGDIETLEQFLRFVSARIAAESGASTAVGRYRFVYSLSGRPLWHVKDFCEAGKVVVSCTPGFLSRKVAAIASLRSEKNEKEVMACHAAGSHDFHRYFFSPANFRSQEVSFLTPRFSHDFFEAAMGPSPSERTAALRRLLSLKLLGRPFFEAELLFRDELRLRFASIIEEITEGRHDKGLHAISIAFEGPPRSGVSTSVAYFSLLSVSNPQSCFFNCFFLPLNFEILFDDSWYEASTGKFFLDNRKIAGKSGVREELLLDVNFFFLTVLRHVVDCMVIQLPSLRNDSHILIQTWEQLVTRSDVAKLRFDGPSLVQLVGHLALHEWKVFAAFAIEVLSAARTAPNDMLLRDAVIEIVLVGLVSHLATALRFSGVVYIIDGLRCLVGVLKDRTLRPLGDAGVLIRSLAQRQWPHTIVAVDTLALPHTATLFPSQVHSVRLLHLLSPELLTTRYGFPVAVLCQGKKFPLQLFVGTPGYVYVLHTLLKAHGWAIESAGDDALYVLRVDDEEVFDALQSFATTLRLEIGV